MSSLRALCFHLAAILVAALVGTPSAEAQLNSQEQQLASIISHASGQNRPFVELDPTLCRVARARAMDMAKRHYFAHVNPDGHGPNYLVRQAGYTLPAEYDQSPAGNSIESCACGGDTASVTWGDWMSSAPHKAHLLAQNPFYVGQTSLGVGFYADPSSDYQYYWVVLTAPPPGPALSITSPVANAGVTSAQATISGTTGGSPATARVVYQLENPSGVSGFTNATGIGTWSAVVTGLVPGPNTVRVRSLDAAGVVLKELTRTFRYVVLKPLVVATEGEGTVTAGFLGSTSRELGMRYAITAKAATGWLFDHWSGSVDSTSAAVSFTMAEGLTVTAHFRVNPFYALKGGYNGLVQADAATHATSGFLKLSVAVAGSFTGRLTLGGKGYAVSGKFDNAGQAAVKINRPLLPPLTLVLSLDLLGGTNQITGTVTDGDFTAAISADQALPATTKHFAAGRYTVSLPANPNDSAAEIPQGAGSALVVVTPAGLATVAGTLADGRAFTATATVSKDGALPIYASLLAGTGSLAGRAAIDPSTGAVAGAVLWTKPQRPTDHLFPAAFATKIPIEGARYIAPKAGVPALEVAATLNNSALQLTGGDLQIGVEQTATLLPTNLITIVNPQLPKLALSLAPTTGRISGSFTHPLTKTTSRISGVILQDRNLGAGFFLGPSASGAASFTPAQ